MGKLIDADKLKAALLKANAHWLSLEPVVSVGDVITLIDEMPAEDAIPVSWICSLIRQEEERKNYNISEYLTDMIWEWHQEDGDEER